MCHTASEVSRTQLVRVDSLLQPCQNSVLVRGSQVDVKAQNMK